MQIDIYHHNDYTEMTIFDNGRQIYYSGFLNTAQSLELIARLSHAASELSDATKKAVVWRPPEDEDNVTDADIF